MLAASSEGGAGCAGSPAAPPRPAPVVEEPIAELELHPEMEPLELIDQASGVATESEFGDEFDVNRLSPEEQELHRPRQIA